MPAENGMPENEDVKKKALLRLAVAGIVTAAALAGLWWLDQGGSEPKKAAPEASAPAPIIAAPSPEVQAPEPETPADTPEATAPAEDTSAPAAPTTPDRAVRRCRPPICRSAAPPAQGEQRAENTHRCAASGTTAQPPRHNLYPNLPPPRRNPRLGQAKAMSCRSAFSATRTMPANWWKS